MKTERLKCPNCGSTELEITKVSEITLHCLFSFTYSCKNCRHNGKISVRKNNIGKVEIIYT